MSTSGSLLRGGGIKSVVTGGPGMGLGTGLGFGGGGSSSSDEDSDELDEVSGAAFIPRAIRSA